MATTPSQSDKRRQRVALDQSDSVGGKIESAEPDASSTAHVASDTSTAAESAQAALRAALPGCERFLGGHGRTSMRDLLTRLAAEAAEDEQPDMYGAGALIEEFEHEIAGLLGKPAGIFMPSGTMAQQIALRIWSERRGLPSVAFHPTCHLELHEQKGYAALHGLRGVLVGDAQRPITLADLQTLAEPVAALLLELPLREIGGQLPAWDDLCAQSAWAREHNVALHLDGARLWEAAPFYDRPYAEIAALFDSVYVSFYKGVGGIAGAMLCGPQEVIAQARVWQRRHGGNLVRLFPYVLAARAGLRERLGRFVRYGERAAAIGRTLAAIEGISIKPDPPQTNMMHVYLRGDRAQLLAAAAAVATSDRVALFWGLPPSEVPNVSWFELAIGDAAEQLTDQEIAGFFQQLMSAAR